jgi:hypothetical protein
VTNLSGSDRGDRRQGSMGENVTLETTLDRSKVTRVATDDDSGDDGGNPRWVTPLVLPALAWYWPEAGDRGGDFRARGGAAVAGDDGNRERPRRFVPCFTLLECPWNRPRSTRAASLEPATCASCSDPWLGMPDLSARKVRILGGLGWR